MKIFYMLMAVLIATSVVLHARLTNHLVLECMHGRLTNHDELVMARALPCDPILSSTTSTVIIPGLIPPDFSAYAPFIVGFTDCEILQFIVKNVIFDYFFVRNRPLTVNYLYVPYYFRHDGNFDNCDMGFYLDSTTNQFRAMIALPGADFTGSSMLNMIWQNAYLPDSSFNSCILTNSNFKGVIAPGIIFCYADLTGSDFHRAYMPESFFDSLTTTDQTIVNHCKFHQAILFKANFSNAQVKHCDFFFCDLDKIDFRGADCSDTNFNDSFGTFRVNTATNFSRANFSKIDRVFFDIPIDQSPVFHDTIMPDGSVCSGPDCVKYFKVHPSTLPSVGR